MWYVHCTSAEMTGNDWNIPHIPRPRINAPKFRTNTFVGQKGENQCFRNKQDFKNPQV